MFRSLVQQLFSGGGTPSPSSTPLRSSQTVNPYLSNFPTTTSSPPASDSESSLAVSLIPPPSSSAGASHTFFPLSSLSPSAAPHFSEDTNPSPPSEHASTTTQALCVPSLPTVAIDARTCFICLEGEEDEPPVTDSTAPVAISRRSRRRISVLRQDSRDAGPKDHVEQQQYGMDSVGSMAASQSGEAASTECQPKPQRTPRQKKNRSARRRRRKELVSCCTQCFAVVHRNCWREWRNNQRLATIRARLLAYNQVDPFSCSICKTGTATVEGEETSMQWAANGPFQQRLQDELFSVVGRMLNEESDDDEPPYCTPITSCISFTALIVVGLIDLFFIWVVGLYPGDVILLSLLACYHLAVVNFLILAIIQRGRTLGLLANRPSDGESDSSSVGYCVVDIPTGSGEICSPRDASGGVQSAEGDVELPCFGSHGVLAEGVDVVEAVVAAVDSGATETVC